MPTGNTSYDNTDKVWQAMNADQIIPHWLSLAIPLVVMVIISLVAFGKRRFNG